jgi:hypothetical protein
LTNAGTIIARALLLLLLLLLLLIISMVPSGSWGESS